MCEAFFWVAPPSRARTASRIVSGISRLCGRGWAAGGGWPPHSTSPVTGSCHTPPTVRFGVTCAKINQVPALRKNFLAPSNGVICPFCQRGEAVDGLCERRGGRPQAGRANASGRPGGRPGRIASALAYGGFGRWKLSTSENEPGLTEELCPLASRRRSLRQHRRYAPG
jgi:hypothetical protein